MTKPIKPSEIIKLQMPELSDEIIECVNAVIASNFHDGRAYVHFQEIVTAIAKVSGKQEKDVLHTRYLPEAIVDAYNGADWTVEYRSDHNEQSLDFVAKVKTKKKKRN